MFRTMSLTAVLVALLVAIAASLASGDARAHADHHGGAAPQERSAESDASFRGDGREAAAEVAIRAPSPDSTGGGCVLPRCCPVGGLGCSGLALGLFTSTVELPECARTANTGQIAVVPTDAPGRRRPKPPRA